MKLFSLQWMGVFLWGVGILNLSFISLSSSSWIMMWALLELILFFMVAIMNKSNVSFYTESSVKYFLIQSMAGMMLLIAGIFILVLNNYGWIYFWLLYASLFVKLGIFPFHFWVIPVFGNNNWANIFLLSGPMKIVPLGVLFGIFTNFKFFFNVILLLALMTSLVGAIIGNNMTQLLKMMAGSSISHTGWMLLSILVGGFFIYLPIYIINMFFFINSVFNGGLDLSLMLLSLGGLPPFLLFFGKLVVIFYVMSISTSILVIMGFLVASILSLNFYLKFSFSSYFTKALTVVRLKSFLIFFCFSGLMMILMS